MEKFVKVQIRINKNGRFVRSIIRDGNTVCETGDDTVFLDDLLNIELPDFKGDFGEVSSDGLTEEGEKAVNAKISKIKTPEWTPEDDGPINKKGKNKEKMGLGFGI